MGLNYSNNKKIGPPGGLRSSLLMAAILALVGACGSEEGLSPSAESPTATAPVDSTVTSDSSAASPDTSLIPVDSTALPPTDSASGAATLAVGTQPGIVFGTFNMVISDLTSIHTGSARGGGLSPKNIVSFLEGARSKGARVVIKLCMGHDKYVKNANGTFSLAKWTALVNQYKNVNLAPYINDGTILGHFLIDEPALARRWGGKVIPQSTIEAMAKHSKQLWPNMATIVRVVPSWLTSASLNYTYLDAGWLQYASGKGDVTKFVAAEVAAAKSKRLGLVVGLNVLDGGNGSSRVRGTYSGRYAMSATEIRNYGTALLKQSYVCGFFNWSWGHFGPSYFARSDVNSSMIALSGLAKSHTRTSCRQ